MGFPNNKNPGDIIHAGEWDDALTGLSTGDYDADNNSLVILRASLGDYVQQGCVWDGPAGDLTANMSGGVVIIGGKYVQVDPVSAHVFAANQDTYTYVDNTGAITHNAVSNDAAPEALPANSVCLGVNISNATAITAVNQDGRWSSAHSYRLYPRLLNNADPAFAVYLSSAQAPAGGTKINLDGLTYDDGGNFDLVNHRFIVPVPGDYPFKGLLTSFMGNGTQTQCALYKNGGIVAFGTGPIVNNTGGNQHMSSVVAADIKLAAGDYVELFAGQATAVSADGTPTQTYLTGHLK